MGSKSISRVQSHRPLTLESQTTLTSQTLSIPQHWSLSVMGTRKGRFRTTSRKSLVKFHKRQGNCRKRFSHMNMVVLAFCSRTRVGRNYRQLQLMVVDTHKDYKSRCEFRARWQEVVVNFVKGWDVVVMTPPTAVLVVGKLFCEPMLVWCVVWHQAQVSIQTKGSSTLANSTSSSYLAGVTYE